ncbi:hypothetical protein OsJ_07406 [Oryza sativa Japonica Group]|nr:hypothetical protein OsJ_07406 [Oryza sativa Japonica Group]
MSLELKLQDFGFTFSEDDVDAELVSIVSGLRRQRSDEDDARKAPAFAVASAEEEAAGRRIGFAPTGASSSSSTLRRPHLSEVWDEEEEEMFLSTVDVAFDFFGCFTYCVFVVAGSVL